MSYFTIDNTLLSQPQKQTCMATIDVMVVKYTYFTHPRLSFLLAPVPIKRLLDKQVQPTSTYINQVFAAQCT